MFYRFSIRLITKLINTFVLTPESVKTTIARNIPAKPREFVFANFMLKLCGFSFSSPRKKTFNPLLSPFLLFRHKNLTAMAGQI